MSCAHAREGAILLRIHKIAAASVLSVIAAGTIVATTATSANAFSFGTVTLSANKNLVNNQSVTVHISGFGTDTGDGTTTGTVLYVVECTPGILAADHNPAHCDESDPTAPDQSPTARPRTPPPGRASRRSPSRTPARPAAPR
jgi:hypothetical protein